MKGFNILFASLLLIQIVTADAQRNRKVMVIRQPPFVYVDEGETGNARYSGFIVDLLIDLSRRVGIDYTIQEVADSKYGSLTNGTWNGMIGELVRGEADIAAAPLTVTSDRQRVVDFTSPFMPFGVALLVNKKDILPRTMEPKYRTYFLEPFNDGVWVLVLTSTLVVTVLFYLTNRFNPYEIIHKSNELGDHDNCGVLGALWLAFGGLVLQGFSRRPRSATSFVLVMTWWMVCLILFATYITGMYYFNSTVVMAGKYTSLEDMVDDHRYNLGAVEDSPTWNYFCKSKKPLNLRVCNKLKRSKVRDVEDGVRKVGSRMFGFFETTPIIQYQVNRNCDLMQFGEKLTSSYFALATPINSDIRSQLDLAILEMRESGNIYKREQVWLFFKPLACPEAEYRKNLQVIGPAEIGFAPRSWVPKDLNVIGSLFLFLLVGVCFAVIALAIEIVYHRRKVRAPKKNEEPLAAKENDNDTEPAAEEI